MLLRGEFLKMNEEILELGCILVYMYRSVEYIRRIMLGMEGGL